MANAADSPPSSGRGVHVSVVKVDDSNRIAIPKDLYDQLGEGDRHQIRWIFGKFERRGGFSPADLAWLLQAMHITGISYSPQVFPVVLHTKKDKAELAALSITARRLVWPCLTDEQMEKAGEMGIRNG